MNPACKTRSWSRFWSDLQIFPSQPPREGAIDVAQMRVGLEEDEDIVEALKLDTVDELIEVAKKTLVVEANVGAPTVQYCITYETVSRRIHPA